MNNKILFRADGSSSMGLGHVYRCLALAGMLGEGYACSFAIYNPDEKVKQLIEASCALLALDTPEAALPAGYTVVLDGYHFTTNYQQQIRAYGNRLVMIDDMADKHIYADVVINHCSSRIAGKYNAASYTRIYAGFDYALLRGPFLAAAREEKTVNSNGACFICLGGADPLNLSKRMLEMVLSHPRIQSATLVTGSAYPFMQELQSITTASAKPVTLLSNIGAVEMITAVRASQLALSSASSIAMEIVAAGCGLLSGMSAGNQQYLYEELLNKKACTGLGNLSMLQPDQLNQAIDQTLDPAALNSQLRMQQQAIDGLAAERIRNVFNNLIAS